MRKTIAGVALLLWLSILLPPGGGDQCLSSPVSVVCPTCPVTLQCYTVGDWLDFFWPDWGVGLL